MKPKTPQVKLKPSETAVAPAGADLGQRWAAADAVPITSAQREELSRRLDDLDHEGPIGIPWDEVLRKVRGQS